MKKVISANHKAISAVLVAVMMMGIVFTALFSGGVKANASTSQYLIDFSGGKVDSTDFYTVVGSKKSKMPEVTYNGTKYTTGLKMDGKASVSFKAPVSGTVNIICASKASGGRVKIGETVCKIDGSESGAELTAKVSAGDVKIVQDNKEIWVFSIEFVPDSSETSYDIKVVDSKSSTKADGETTSVVEGKDCTLEAADADNFLYWVNSNNRIVSRDAKYTFPVYYADTYTAVYKSETPAVKFMTAYNQVLSEVSIDELQESSVPAGPVKYGYEFDKWSMTVDEIKAAGKEVEVTPVYKEVTGNVDITINETTKSYKKNDVVLADATELENFMYWHVTGDESKVLSYNSLYYFYADDKMTSVTAKCGTDTVEQSGIITHITNYQSGNNKTFVFEFTVPDGYKIEFAGIVASSTTDAPSLTDYEYIRGGSTNAKTYRYSWTKTNATGTTWNVRPILKYSDGQGNIKTIETSGVQKF